jgi:hypothetical protein
MAFNRIRICNEEIKAMANKLFIYSLANYESGGLLINVYNKEGINGLNELLRSTNFKCNMYCDGNGKEFSTTEESHIICDASDDYKDFGVSHLF